MKILPKPSRAGRRAEKAFRRAVAKVIDENRKLGIPIAVMRNGQAVLIPVEQVVRGKRETYGSKGRK